MIVQCPVPNCRAGNEAGTETCARCGTPLEAYGRLLARAAWLFNSGLAAARAGNLAAARDWFAATVHWCPYDLEARNALALACYHLGDHAGARHHWGAVQRRAPRDELASKGLAVIEQADTRPDRLSRPRSPARHHHRKRRR